MLNRVTQGASTESAASQPRGEAAAGLLLLVRPGFVDQGLKDGRVLSGDPFFGYEPGQILVAGPFRIEDSVDRPVRELLWNALGAEFGGECRTPLGSVTQAVAHEGGGHTGVVDETALFQTVQTDVDSGRSKSLLAQAFSEFRSGAGPVREQVQGGVPNPNVRVVIEEFVSEYSAERVSYTQETPFERLEHHFERFRVVVEVDEDVQASAAARLDSSDGRVGAQNPTSDEQDVRVLLSMRSWVFFSGLSTDAKRAGVRLADGTTVIWGGSRSAAICRSASLHIPLVDQEVMVESQHLSVVEDDRPVIS